MIQIRGRSISHKGASPVFLKASVTWSRAYRWETVRFPPHALLISTAWFTALPLQ